MSDKYNLSDELNQSRELDQDQEKETAIYKHLADIGVMDKLVFALNEYIIKFLKIKNTYKSGLIKYDRTFWKI